MGYPYIRWVLQQEDGTEFQSIHQRWRPRTLFLQHQVRLLLKDMQARYTDLELARQELATLEYAAKYLKYLARMRIWIRDAHFAWKADQLKFLKSVAGFYSDYGAVLRLLKFDELRGKFTEPAVTQVETTGV